MTGVRLYTEVIWMSPVWSQRRLPAKVIEKVFDISKKKKKKRRPKAQLALAVYRIQIPFYFAEADECGTLSLGPFFVFVFLYFTKRSNI